MIIEPQTTALLLLIAVTAMVQPATGQEPAEEKRPLDAYIEAMNIGKGYLDRSQTDKAIDAFVRAVEIHPTELGARLNLANSYLAGGKVEEAARHAREALHVDRNVPAAYYILGCALQRAGDAKEALKALQQCHRLKPGIAVVSYQLARVYRALDLPAEAVAALRDCIRLEPRHPSAHYMLSQLLLLTGDRKDAAAEIRIHEEIRNSSPGIATDETALERCEFTRAVTPQTLDQPASRGITVTFKDATDEMLKNAGGYSAPIGVIDADGDGDYDFLVREGKSTFRLLDNVRGKLDPVASEFQCEFAAQARRCLVGDLDNDGYEDCIVIGGGGTMLLRGGQAGLHDTTAASGLSDVRASDAVLADIDHTGKLSLLDLSPSDGSLHFHRNRGDATFEDVAAQCGIPADWRADGIIEAVDWNRDEATDLIIGRSDRPAVLIANQLLGQLKVAEPSPQWPMGRVLVVGDLDNDLRPDLLVVHHPRESGKVSRIECVRADGERGLAVELGKMLVEGLLLTDYDNDGWQDLVAFGSGLRVWRNEGLDGFSDSTSALGIDKLIGNARIDAVAALDLNSDGGTDLVCGLSNGGLRILRNEGGNANRQLKLRLSGTRSNRSGIGVLIEVRAGPLRAARTVSRLPIEVGVGSHERLDSLTVVWSDQIVQAEVMVEVPRDKALKLTEPQVTSASCPYLYAWDGTGFRFVTDILGASPLGLPQNQERLIEADATEYVWISGDEQFQPVGGQYRVSVTEELREVLYLDEVRLTAVDHPAKVEVHPNDKLRPVPFPQSELVALSRPLPLLHAEADDGADLTEPLAAIDGNVSSPPTLRRPQLRGLTEPHSIILDFGPLPAGSPLVLALTGWLQYGGGTANVAASQDPNLPPPFPALAVETSAGQWREVNIVVGAPAGKTKTILVDVLGLLPADARRLRLTSCLEIHWDRIALFERRNTDECVFHSVPPVTAQLRRHGFGDTEPRDPRSPLRPIYERVHDTPPWRFTPAGWCTRYGDVLDLVRHSDNALAILNGGDEVVINFEAASLPPVPFGWVRDFFFYSVGWEKDADYHVRLGRSVEPLPFHGLNDQFYGRESPPPANRDWVSRYNTRWVGPSTEAP